MTRGVGVLALVAACGGATTPARPMIGNDVSDEELRRRRAELPLSRDTLAGEWDGVDGDEGGDWTASFEFSADGSFVWGQPGGGADECPARGQVDVDPDEVVFRPDEDDCAPTSDEWRWEVVEYTGDRLVLRFEGSGMELQRR